MDSWNNIDIDAHNGKLLINAFDVEIKASSEGTLLIGNSTENVKIWGSITIGTTQDPVTITGSTVTCSTMFKANGGFYSVCPNMGFIQTHRTSGTQISFGVGSDGTNRGIYDGAQSGWMMRRGSGTEIYFGGGLRPETTASYILGDTDHIWYNLYTEAIRLYRNTAYYFGFGGTPSANRTITFQNASGTVAFTSSDARLKENIKDTDLSGLDMINKMQIRQFDWIDDESAGYNKGRHQTIGFVADELEKLDKYFIVNGSGGEDEDGNINPKCVDTFYLLGYITKALQELSAKVDELEKKVR